MDTIAARLTLALQRKDMTVRGFQKALKNRKTGKIPGTSYANIRRYLSDDADSLEPSPTFLQAAAEELGVRVEWLTFNSGKAEDPKPVGDRSVFHEVMANSFPPYLLARPTVQEGLSAVWWEAVRRRADHSAGREARPLEANEVAKGDVGRKVAEHMGHVMRWPMHVAGADPVDLNEPISRDAYLLALTQALTIASQTFMRKRVAEIPDSPADIEDMEE